MSEKKDFFELDPETFLERIESSDISSVSIPEQSFEKQIPLIQIEPVLEKMGKIKDQKGNFTSASNVPGQTLKGMDGFYYISLKDDSGNYIWYLLK